MSDNINVSIRDNRFEIVNGFKIVKSDVEQDTEKYRLITGIYYDTMSRPPLTSEVDIWAASIVYDTSGTITDDIKNELQRNIISSYSKIFNGASFTELYKKQLYAYNIGNWSLSAFVDAINTGKEPEDLSTLTDEDISTVVQTITDINTSTETQNDSTGTNTVYTEIDTSSIVNAIETDDTTIVDIPTEIPDVSTFVTYTDDDTSDLVIVGGGDQEYFSGLDIEKGINCREPYVPGNYSTSFSPAKIEDKANNYIATIYVAVTYNGIDSKPTRIYSFNEKYYAPDTEYDDNGRKLINFDEMPDCGSKDYGMSINRRFSASNGSDSDKLIQATYQEKLGRAYIFPEEWKYWTQQLLDNTWTTSKFENTVVRASLSCINSKRAADDISVYETSVESADYFADINWDLIKRGGVPFGYTQINLDPAEMVVLTDSTNSPYIYTVTYNLKHDSSGVISEQHSFSETVEYRKTIARADLDVYASDALDECISYVYDNGDSFIRPTTDKEIELQAIYYDVLGRNYISTRAVNYWLSGGYDANSSFSTIDGMTALTNLQKAYLKRLTIAKGKIYPSANWLEGMDNDPVGCRDTMDAAINWMNNNNGWLHGLEITHRGQALNEADILNNLGASGFSDWYNIFASSYSVTYNPSKKKTLYSTDEYKVNYTINFDNPSFSNVDIEAKDSITGSFMETPNYYDPFAGVTIDDFTVDKASLSANSLILEMDPKPNPGETKEIYWTLTYTPTGDTKSGSFSYTAYGSEDEETSNGTTITNYSDIDNDDDVTEEDDEFFKANATDAQYINGAEYRDGSGSVNDIVATAYYDAEHRNWPDAEGWEYWTAGGGLTIVQNYGRDTVALTFAESGINEPYLKISAYAKKYINKMGYYIAYSSSNALTVTLKNGTTFTLSESNCLYRLVKYEKLKSKGSTTQQIVTDYSSQTCDNITIDYRTYIPTKSSLSNSIADKRLCDLSTSEWNTNVDTIYLASLGRYADSAGADYWKNDSTFKCKTCGDLFDQLVMIRDGVSNWKNICGRYWKDKLHDGMSESSAESRFTNAFNANSVMSVGDYKATDKDLNSCTYGTIVVENKTDDVYATAWGRLYLQIEKQYAITVKDNGTLTDPNTNNQYLVFDSWA